MTQDKNIRFNDKYRIPSARLKNYDYGKNGAYFVTLCTKNREHYFGKIENARMQYSTIGDIACEYWRQIPNHFPFVILEEWIVMPNHIHGILIFDKPDPVEINRRDARFYVSTTTASQQNGNKFGPQSKNLASVIRGFKAGVTKFARQHMGMWDIWQPRFHDHIIRNENEFGGISEYIMNNPLNWLQDDYHN